MRPVSDEAVSDEAVALAELMPWSSAPVRPGREWVTAPDPRSLTARWDALLRAGGGPERAALFGETRSRTLRSRVPQLPGQTAPTVPLARAEEACPPPVPVLFGPYDQRWLIPDHRVLDAARPEVWRVADGEQLFVVEAADPDTADEQVAVTGLLPLTRGGRIRPLHRRPGGVEPNLAPGLLPLLADRFGRVVDARGLTAWTAAATTTGPRGDLVVPLPGNPELWDEGVELGREALRLRPGLPGGGERPKLPGGRRPYVRAPIPARPVALRYEAEDEALLLLGDDGSEGRIAPVARAVWEFRAGGAGVLESWFAGRAAGAGGSGASEGLAAIGPAGWSRRGTSALLELITVLTLAADLRPRRRAFAERLRQDAHLIGTRALTRAGVLPVPSAARRPASVLDHHEEGPDGQFALV
ncbi:DNA methyltransferase [Streptomyces sp. PTM05]|uniref:DNA methyltransferase n=1 Tax=Streptantibioticus parmotrematis TaxID=2873249 RepID=A0ABS7QN36_9ACTN|nr:DNA methyltransferase [Streptantibioticus parmotrematis]